MVLSLQAIDFLLASSIQDGWPLSDMDCNADGSVGDDEGDEEDPTFFRSHLSSRGLSGILVGLDSERKHLWSPPSFISYVLIVLVLIWVDYPFSHLPRQAKGRARRVEIEVQSKIFSPSLVYTFIHADTSTKEITTFNGWIRLSY